MKSKVAVMTRPEHFEIREIDIVPNENQVLVRVKSCGLCNWELNHYHGLLGKYPQMIGHEWNGVVVEVGEKVKNIKLGDKVAYCPMGQIQPGFAEYAVAEENMLMKLPDNVPLELAIVEPLKCVVTVAKATRAEVGDYGVIQGCGPMGLWCLSLLAGNMLSGLIAVDIDDDKLKLAKKFGATHTINSQAQNVEEELAKITKGHLADFVVEATGISALLENAMKLVKVGRGRVVMMSSHKNKVKEIDFRIAVDKSLEIIVAHPQYTYDTMDDMRRAVNMLANGVFRMNELVTHTYKLEDINTAFKELDHKPGGFVKGIVVMDQ